MKKWMVVLIIICILCLTVFIVFGRTAGPNFDIKVILSDSASNKLKELGEDIIVYATFDGDAKDKYSGANNAPHRDVYLGSKDIRIEYGRIAKFRNIKFSKLNYIKLKDRKYYITINVVSGRKADQNNLLNCSVPIGISDEFVNKITTVHCELIYK